MRKDKDDVFSLQFISLSFNFVQCNVVKLLRSNS